MSTQTVLLRNAVWIGGVQQAANTTQTVNTALAAELVHRGDATYVSDPMAGRRQSPANFLLDKDGNVTGLVGPGGLEMQFIEVGGGAGYNVEV
jgi:hypothetical protein